MQRGFKSYAEQIAVEVRNELGLASHARLCAFRLAEYLGVPTISFSSLFPAAGSLGLTEGQKSALIKEVHGVCIPLPSGGRAIVFNDTNSPVRQQSDVAHEAAHVLLQHAVIGSLGAQTAKTQEQESEATYLGGALLLPRPAALLILRRNLPRRDAAELYGVSEEMVTYRCNVSGARAIQQRLARTGHRQ